jgi:hypothetical protein
MTVDEFVKKWSILEWDEETREQFEDEVHSVWNDGYSERALDE